VPATEAVIVAADNHFAALVAPVVRPGTVKSRTDDIFRNPVVLVADNAISIPAPIPLVGLRVGCARETQSTTQYSRSQSCLAKYGLEDIRKRCVLPGVSRTALGCALYSMNPPCTTNVARGQGAHARKTIEASHKQKERSGYPATLPRNLKTSGEDDRGRARPNRVLCAISSCLHPTSDDRVPNTIPVRGLARCAVRLPEGCPNHVSQRLCANHDQF
jgi:hypothetical protein